nr:F368 [uncultured bacterium]
MFSLHAAPIRRICCPRWGGPGTGSSTRGPAALSKIKPGRCKRRHADMLTGQRKRNRLLTARSRIMTPVAR